MWFITIRGQHLAPGLVAQVLAMVVLGPVPAVAMSVLVAILICVGRGLRPSAWLNNLAAFAVFPLVGGVLTQLLIGNVHDPANQLAQGPIFALVVFGVFLIANALNFLVIALDNYFLENQPLLSQIRETFTPMLPGQTAAAALTGDARRRLHQPRPAGRVRARCSSSAIFQYLLVALLRSEDRADQLEARTVHLASLQLGVLTTLVETLALRDRMTARHAAAVARYARALAKEIGCSRGRPGPDPHRRPAARHRQVRAARPDPQSRGALRRGLGGDPPPPAGRRDARRPARRLRAGRRGDPLPPRARRRRRLPGRADRQRDPAASRIVAICSTYDTLTARETYRAPMTPQDAMTELRRVAGRQLDAELVESFIAMLEREGSLTFVHGDDADFEAELAFERRARQIASSRTRAEQSAAVKRQAERSEPPARASGVRAVQNEKGAAPAARRPRRRPYLDLYEEPICGNARFCLLRLGLSGHSRGGARLSPSTGPLRLSRFAKDSTGIDGNVQFAAACAGLLAHAGLSAPSVDRWPA